MIHNEAVRGPRPDGRYWAVVEDETWDGRRHRRMVYGATPDEVIDKVERLDDGVTADEIAKGLIAAEVRIGIAEIEQYLAD